MKIPLPIILLPFLFCAVTAGAQTNALFTTAPVTTGKLEFKYPAAEVHSNLAFIIYTSPSLTIAHTNWQVLTQFNSLETNTYTLTNGTNIYTVRVPVWYGAQFYAASATDSFWGESFFSNPAWTNPLPRRETPLQLSR